MNLLGSKPDTTEPVDLASYSINELPELVKKLKQLIRNGSWELGESIIKSTKLAKAGNLDEAINEMTKFKSSSNSPFYNKRADAHIRNLKDKIRRTARTERYKVPS